MSGEEKVRNVLFGSGVRRVRIDELSKRTGIPQGTLYSYRKHPYSIPLDRLRIMSKVLALTDEEKKEVIG